MRKFFEIGSDGNLTIDPHLYSVNVFKKIWDRDKTKAKEKATMDLSYIFWMCDFRSYVADITDEGLRKEEVIKLVSPKGKYKADKLVEEAIEVYKRDIPLSLLFLEDTKVAVNELREFFRTVDLQERDLKTGKPVHTSSNLMTNISKAGDLIETLEKLEKKVTKDMDTSNSIQGGKTKGFFED